jgi:exopolysaccharide biosynthesis polyprenyl glycosylphosphotransferase
VGARGCSLRDLVRRPARAFGWKSWPSCWTVFILGAPVRHIFVHKGAVRPVEPSARLTSATDSASRPRSAWRRLVTRSPVEAPRPGPVLPLRLNLQRRARENMHRHVVRAAMRFGALLLADLASFYVMRQILRAARNEVVVGTWVAGLTQSVLPGGILNGWQFASALFVSLAILGCYGAGDQRRDPRRLFTAAALATALPLWMAIWIRGPSLVALQYGLTTVLLWGGLVVDRLGVEWIVARVRTPERAGARTLFVGTATECNAIARMPAFDGGGEFQSVGFVDVQVPPAPEALGHFVELARLIHGSGAEAVVVCGQLSDSQLVDVTDGALATGCQLLMQPRGVDVPGVEPAIVWRRGQPLLELTAPTLKGYQLVLKRAIDVVGSVAGLVVLSPLFAFVALRIKLDSAGPVLFRQERVGREGRRFKILKFRTMARDAEQRREGLQGRSIYRDPRLFKVPDDPRMTRVGRWLRRTSLDELPQLLNVLKGEMSLVGPRPPLLCEVELYEAHHYARFDVKPGMTGPWQVSGRNQVTDFEEVVSLETTYIRDWTLGRDVGILFRTIPVVIGMRGAH